MRKVCLQLGRERHSSRARPSPHATSSRRPPSSVLLRKVPIDKSLHLNQSLAYQTVSGILIGNQHYDQITIGVPRLFGVREATSYLNFLGNISIGSELPVSITKEPVPSAAQAYHLELVSQKPKTACLFILNGHTVVFVATSLIREVATMSSSV